MKQVSKLNILLFVVAIVLVSSLFNSALSTPSQAAPALVPTPVASVNLGNVGKVITIFRTEAITQTTRHCTRSSAFNTLDIQYTLDLTSTNVNTVALILEYSNDTVNFETGPRLTLSGTDGESVLTQRASFGAFVCINAVVSNTNTITIGVNAVGK